MIIVVDVDIQTYGRWILVVWSVYVIQNENQKMVGKVLEYVVT